MGIDTKVDSVKKGRILAVAIISTLAILATKLLSVDESLRLYQILFRGIGYSALVYLALIWALRFQVTLYSIIFVLSQVFVYFFAQYTFLEIFFFRGVGRVYEILIMVLIALLLFVGNYVSFLAANIFNVSTIKEIPLIQAARTASYVLSILATFFLTFSLIDSGISLYIIIPSLFLSYFVVSFLHIKNTEIEIDGVVEMSLINALVMLISMAPIVFLHSIHTVGALLPSVVFYILIGILMHKNKGILTKLDMIIYISTFLFIVTINIIASI